MSGGTRDHWKTISRILDEALELSPSHRVTWLSTLDTAYPAYSEQIRLLLQDHEALQNCGFLDSVSALELTETCQPLFAEKVGTTIGPYRLMRQLGSGGMGVVWLAQQEHPIRRLVAIKVVKPGAESGEGLSRFELERQALAVLNHPGIAKVFEAGSTEDGLPYFVMEYIAGLPITEFSDQQGLSITDRLRLFVKVCEAVDHAHQKGVLHRDLKPRNILVCQDGGESSVKIIDFGIAKSIGQDLLDELPQTQLGMVVGTPEYMSPEQAGVVRGPVDRRSDVYSLGVVLYELLAGTLPFDGRELRRRTVVEALRIMRDQEALPLSGAVANQPDDGLARIASRRDTTGATLARQLRGDLEWITARAMSKAPDERYGSVSDLRSDIGRHLEGRPVLAGPPSVLYRARKFARRHHRLAGAAAAVSLAITSSVAALTFYIQGASARDGEVPTSETRGAAAAATGSASAMSMPQPLTSFTGIEAEPAWSRDGRRIAFIWNGEREDNFDVYVLHLGQGTPVRLTTDPGMEVNPAWSPDGRWIAYNRPGTTKSPHSIELISMSDGARRTLLQHTAPLGAVDWSTDGRSIIFEMVRSSQRISDLWVMSLDSGRRHRITSAPEGIVGDVSPALSPDGRTLAFCRRTAWARSELYLLDVGPELTPVGEPRRVTELGAVDRPTWAPDGARILFESDAHGSGIWQLDRRTGRVSPVFGPPATATQPAIAKRPDGSASLVFTHQINEIGIWRYPVPLAPLTPPLELVPSTRNQTLPEFSRDGKRIAFSSTRSGAMEIWIADANGKNEVQVTNLRHALTEMGHWSPDDELIAFDSHGRGPRQIYVVNASGGAATPVTNDEAAYGSGWARDGTAYYYTSSRTGRREVWKTSRPDWVQQQVTFAGGESGFESGSGTFYYWVPETWQPVLKRRTAQRDERVTIVPAANPRSMAIPAPGGFYYKSAVSSAVYLYNETTGSSVPVVELPKWFERFTVSPDGRWFAAGFAGKSTIDLMIMEQFR